MLSWDEMGSSVRKITRSDIAAIIELDLRFS